MVGGAHAASLYEVASFPGPRFNRLHEGKAEAWEQAFALPSCNRLKRGAGNEARYEACDQSAPIPACGFAELEVVCS